jgi:hypothetical protein
VESIKPVTPTTRAIPLSFIFLAAVLVHLPLLLVLLIPEKRRPRRQVVQAPGAHENLIMERVIS